MTTGPEMQKLKAADRMHFQYIYPCAPQIKSARGVFGPNEVLQVELGPSFMSISRVAATCCLIPTQSFRPRLPQEAVS